MKFIICVVILAFAAVNSEAGFLPPAVVDVSHGAWPGAWSAAPWGAGHWGAPYWGAHAAYGPSLTTTSHWGAWSAPYAPYGPSAAYHADPAPHGHDGKYVATTRGAQHIAPLVGHVQSVASTNVQPAPGTTY